MIAHSKKWKVLLHIFLMVICAVILVILARPSPVTCLGAFRQKEKQQLTGPADILETLHFSNNPYDRTTVGQSEYGYTVLLWHSDDDFRTAQMTYYPKEDSITAIAPYADCGLSNRKGFVFPLLVFAEYPHAETAHLTLRFTENAHTQTYELDARIRPDGYFLFPISDGDISEEMLLALQIYFSANYEPIHSLTVQVTLLDHRGTEIDSKIF